MIWVRETKTWHLEDDILEAISAGPPTVYKIGTTCGRELAVPIDDDHREVFVGLPDSGLTCIECGVKAR